MTDASQRVTVVGAGLAGSEAALQLAARDVPVRLIEMRPQVGTAVHHTGEAAELVCSNSLKSLDATSAAGCLKYELQRMGSVVLAEAFANRVPAGGALAVDRKRFSRAVTTRIEASPLIELERHEVTSIDGFLANPSPTIIATGPLTTDPLADSIAERLAERGGGDTYNYVINGLSVAPESALARAMNATFEEAGRLAEMGSRR